MLMDGGISPGTGQVAEQSGKAVLMGGEGTSTSSCIKLGTGEEASTGRNFLYFFIKYYTPFKCVFILDYCIEL